MAEDTAVAPTQQRVWDAAIELFGREGFAATGIRDIARGAGITVATLYHYMTGKEELLRRIMIDAMDVQLSAARPAETRYSDPRERLEHLVRRHIDFHCRFGLVARVTDSELRSLNDEARRKVVALRDEYEAIWRRTLRYGHEQGTFEVGDLNLTTKALLGMCSSVYDWYRPDGRLSVDEIGDEYCAIALRQCAPRTPRA